MDNVDESEDKEQQMHPTAVEVQLQAIATSMDLMEKSTAGHRASVLLVQLYTICAAAISVREGLHVDLQRCEALLVAYLPDGAHFKGEEV